MAGARSRRLRARDGGQPQGGGLRGLLAEELRRALLPRPRGSEAPRRTEWTCAPCSATNWSDRSKCRSCGKAKGAKKTEGALPGASAWPSLGGKGGKGKGSGDGKDDDKNATEEKKERPPAPEARAAELVKQAAALESSACSLRLAGLEDRAKELDAEAAALRKRAEGPTPGKRVDLAEAYLRRCEARAAKAKEAEIAAEKALKDAKKDVLATDKELADATAQLNKLRKDLAPELPGTKRGRWTEAAADDEVEADKDHKDDQAVKQAKLEEQEAELATLRAKLAEAEAQVTPATAPPGSTEANDQEMVDLKPEELAELQKQLGEAAADHSAACAKGGDEAKNREKLEMLATLATQCAKGKRFSPYAR